MNSKWIRWCGQSCCGLTVAQRVAFGLLILACVIGNCLYLSYLIGRVRDAEANPITVIGRAPAFPGFPNMGITVNAVSPDGLLGLCLITSFRCQLQSPPDQ
jgi:hypothetical protein